MTTKQTDLARLKQLQENLEQIGSGTPPDECKNRLDEAIIALQAIASVDAYGEIEMRKIVAQMDSAAEQHGLCEWYEEKRSICRANAATPELGHIMDMCRTLTLVQS